MDLVGFEIRRLIYHAVTHVHCSDEHVHPSRQEIHGYPTRYSHKREIPRNRLSRTQETTKPLSIKLYNKLPKHVTDLDLKQFKTKIRELLLNNAFYTIEEFIEYNFN